MIQIGKFNDNCVQLTGYRSKPQIFSDQNKEMVYV